MFVVQKYSMKTYMTDLFTHQINHILSNMKTLYEMIGPPLMISEQRCAFMLRKSTVDVIFALEDEMLMEKNRNSCFVSLWI